MYNYKVFKNSLLTPSVRSIILKGENNTAFHFEPGQYVAISMRQKGRPTTTRCFSVSSSPIRRRYLEICSRVKGKYTTAMQNLAPGDVVTVRGPFGRFVFNEEMHQRFVLFGGGIGITPFMSMIRYANDLSLSTDIHLVYSCRNQDDISFFEELLEIEKHNHNFHITFVISSGETDRLKNERVIVGKINEDNLSKLNLEFSKDTFMICGPAPYLKSIRSILSLRGIPSERLLSEAFSQGKHAQTDTLKRWPFNMYALAGLSFVLATLFVTASDLLKTLPKLKETYQNVSVQTKKAGGITTLEPQVSTDISQPTIIRYVKVSSIVSTPAKSTPPVVTTITPVPPVAATTITPAPKPARVQPLTVTPIARPRTKVS